jgi:molybdate transport system substrate-binding protein
MRKRRLVNVALAMLLSLMMAFGLAGCAAPATEDKDGGANQTQGGTDTDKSTDTPETPAPLTPVQLSIFAANSLEKALPEVQALYTKKHPEVTFADTQFKASGDLVEQIKSGGTPDLLITASSGSMDTAVSNGSIDEATRITMFGNDLVIVRKTGSSVTVASLDDVKKDEFSAIAIGDGELVPAGQYANQALNSIGLYSDASGKGGAYDPSFESKVRTASSVGNAAKYVESGDCQIGFVYTSDIYRFTGIETAFVVPTSAHKAIVYPGAVLKGSKNADAAKSFLDFCMTDADAQVIWSKYGFEVK